MLGILFFLYPGRLFQWAVDLSSFVQDSLSTAFGPALAFYQCYFVIFDFPFQGVEPVDYGPGADRQQGAKTRVCSPVLVPGMQGLS